MTRAYYCSRRSMTNYLQLVWVCDGWGTPVTDKLDFKATYMLETVINEQSLAMVCNFVTNYNLPDYIILIMCLIWIWLHYETMCMNGKCRQAKKPNSFKYLGEKQRITSVCACICITHVRKVCVWKSAIVSQNNRRPSRIWCYKCKLNRFSIIFHSCSRPFHIFLL